MFKPVRLQTEYMGIQKTSVTVHGVPAVYREQVGDLFREVETNWGCLSDNK